MGYMAPLVMDGEVVGTICGPGEMRRFRDEPNGDPRWCFTCRKVREFRFTVDDEIEPNYYGPIAAVRCGTCDTVDGDCFPGWSRRWDEE